MPTIGKARGIAQEVICASQLRSIGQAIALYQKEFDGKNPPNLKVLIETEDLSPEMLISPLSNDSVGDCSYIYRGADLINRFDSLTVLAHDKPNASIMHARVGMRQSSSAVIRSHGSRLYTSACESKFDVSVDPETKCAMSLL